MASHSTRALFSSPPASPESKSSRWRSFVAENRAFVAERRSVDSGSAISAASCARNYDEKENGERNNCTRVWKMDSPSKNCKNFMSPTISAASKFTSSPRKKVFAERNDPIRASSTLSDGKVAFFSSKSQYLDQKSGSGGLRNSHSECSLDSLTGEKKKPPKKVLSTDRSSDSDSETADHNTSKPELSFSPSYCCSVAASSIAPLDADPSLQPYDPKTNYLSPRPQFLYYRPKPRTDILLNREKGLHPEFEGSLMADMMSESFSEASGSGESHADDKDEFPVITSYDMVIGTEELEFYPPVSENCCTNAESASGEEATASEIKERDLWEEEDEPEAHDSQAFEPLALRETPKNAEPDARSDKKTKKKYWGFSRLMCFSMFLTLFLACTTICFIHSPSLEKVVPEDFTLSNVRALCQESLVAAEKEFRRLGKHANQLSLSLVSYVFQLVDELGKGGKRVQIQYMNISDLQKVTWNQENLNNIDFKVEANTEALDEAKWHEETDLEENFDLHEFMLESLVEAIPDVEDELEIVGLAQNLEKEYVEEALNGDELQIMLETEVVTPNLLPSIPEWEEPKHYQESKHEDESETVEKKTEESSDEVQNKEISLYHLVHENTNEAASEDGQSSQTLEGYRVTGVSGDITTSPDPELLSPLQHNYRAMEVTLIIFAAASLMGISFFIHQRKRGPSSEHFHERTGPSETSSSFENSSSGFKNDTGNEAGSWERRANEHMRRDSSSGFSSDSHSYGSFTTFERIPIKSVNGEEKILTPVRRSSRIRTQLTQ